MNESLFNNDNDYIADDKDYSEGSDDEYRVSKAKKQLKKSISRSRSKSKRSKKTLTKIPCKEGSRRSARTTSSLSYCEDSGDSDDLYELCAGQPKLTKQIKRDLPVKVTPEKSLSKEKQSKKKSFQKVSSVKSTSECVATITPDLVKTNFLSSSRSSCRKRSQVSYAEASSDDDLDMYELFDGQPIKRSSAKPSVGLVGSTLSKHKKSKLKKTSDFSKLDPNDEIEGESDADNSSEKVVLVHGQPVLKSKALSMLEEENQFFIENVVFHMTEQDLMEPLCIWKLHGKLLEKFVQIDFSKVCIYLATIALCICCPMSVLCC